MTTQEIATRFVELCRQGKYDQVYQELYVQNARSVEPPNTFGMETVEGLAKFKGKADAFNALIEEFHSSYMSDPIVAGNHFAVGMGMDANFKGMGRMDFEELAVYTVEDGKVVEERFFYS